MKSLPLQFGSDFSCDSSGGLRLTVNGKFEGQEPHCETYIRNKNIKFHFWTLTDLISDVIKMGPSDKASMDGINSIHYKIFEKPVILV